MRDFTKMWKDDLREIKGNRSLGQKAVTGNVFVRAFKRSCIGLVVSLVFFLRCFVFIIDALWFLSFWMMEEVVLSLVKGR